MDTKRSPQPAYEAIGSQIAEFLNTPIEKTKRLISPASGTRFVVCGTSGSGKTRAIYAANSRLPLSEQIAESQDILRVRDPAEAERILNDPELEYEDSLHIAFNVVSSYLAKALEEEGVKVFWLDGGSTGNHWRWHGAP